MSEPSPPPLDEGRGPLRRFLDAAPLVAVSVCGLGPLAGWLELERDGAGHVVLNPTMGRLVLDSLGVSGRKFIELFELRGGSMSYAELDFETQGMDSAERSKIIARLIDLELLTEDLPEGIDGLSLRILTDGLIEPFAESYGAHFAITSEQLAEIIRFHGVEPPTRKGERIDLLSELFADPSERDSIQGRVSPEAWALLERVADTAGLAPVALSDAGIDSMDLYRFRAAHRTPSSYRLEPISPLWELMAAGVLGADPHDAIVWIWREAWPVLGRPMFTDWTTVEEPLVEAPPLGGPHRMPDLVATIDRCLTYWASEPPNVLKNGDKRFAKTVIRATAKSLGVSPAVVELVSEVVIELELVLRNTVAASGRGRRRVVDEVWLADPDVVEAWSATPMIDRWLHLVARWATEAGDERAVACRQVALYELLRLDAVAWESAEAAASWLEHRFAPLGDVDDFAAVLNEAQALELMTQPTVALTELGRLALTEPSTAANLTFGRADSVIIQPDLSVIAPPDLDPGIAAELAEYATLESRSGATTYRLDEKLITRAAQSGQSGEEIIQFLEAISAVALSDTVLRMVQDSVAQADRFEIHGAASVLVADDPVDLATAVRVRAAKLTPISDTVALSLLDPTKLRAALARKSVEASIVGLESETQPRRRSADGAERLDAELDHWRALAERTGVRHYDRRIEQLESRAAALRNPSSRFVPPEMPLALSPDRLARLLDSVDEP